MEVRYNGFSFEELINKYTGVNNIPLNKLIQVIEVYGLVIKGLGNGKVRLIREAER